MQILFLYSETKSPIEDLIFSTRRPRKKYHQKWMKIKEKWRTKCLSRCAFAAPTSARRLQQQVHRSLCGSTVASLNLDRNPSQQCNQQSAECFLTHIMWRTLHTPLRDPSRSQAHHKHMTSCYAAEACILFTKAPIHTAVDNQCFKVKRKPETESQRKRPSSKKFRCYRFFVLTESRPHTSTWTCQSTQNARNAFKTFVLL